jgi:membrane-associated phospholipid phosphatase
VHVTTGTIRRWITILTVAASLLAGSGAAHADDIKKAGDVLRFAMPIFAGGYSLASGDDEGLVQFAKSFLVSSGIAFGLKKAIHSERPNHKDDESFPSGHVVNAVSAASYLDHRYGWKFGLPSYLLAAFVGYSRVESHEHHVIDVVGGAFLSWGVSHIFVTPLPLQLGAEVGRDRALLRISAQW